MVIRGTCPHCGRGVRVSGSNIRADKLTSKELEADGQLKIQQEAHPEVSDDSFPDLNPEE